MEHMLRGRLSLVVIFARVTLLVVCVASTLGVLIDWPRLPAGLFRWPARLGRIVDWGASTPTWPQHAVILLVAIALWIIFERCLSFLAKAELSLWPRSTTLSPINNVLPPARTRMQSAFPSWEPDGDPMYSDNSRSAQPRASELDERTGYASTRASPRRSAPVFLTSQDIERGSVEGRSHFHVPPKMKFAEAARVTYTVAKPALFMSATEKPVRMTPVMAASLSGRGFSIASLSASARRAVSLETPNTWQWDVTPLEVGKLELEVRLMGYLTLDRRDTPTEFEADRRTVFVHIGPFGWIKRHAAALQWGVATLFAFFSVLLAIPFIADALKDKPSKGEAKVVAPSRAASSAP